MNNIRLDNPHDGISLAIKQNSWHISKRRFVIKAGDAPQKVIFDHDCHQYFFLSIHNPKFLHIPPASSNCIRVTARFIMKILLGISTKPTLQ